MMAGIKVTKTGEWEVARFKLATGVTATAPAIKRALAQEANWLRKVIVQGIRKQRPGGQQFAKLSRMTIATRRLQGFRGRKALIRNGDLIGSINVKKFNGGFGAFVGILRTAKSKDGERLINVALAHEYGIGPFTIQMTDKMRRFLFAAMAASRIKPTSDGSGGGTGVVVIRVQARPFFRPVFEKVAKPALIKDRMLRRVNLNMNQMFGKTTNKPPK